MSLTFKQNNSIASVHFYWIVPGGK